LARFALRRLLYSLPVLLVGSFLLFWAVRTVFDPLLKLRQVRDPSLIARETERLGLDQGIVIQYWRWLSGFLTGDWGVSSRTSGSVRPMIQSALTVALELLIWGLIFATLAAVLIGVWSAVRQYSFSDHALTGLSYLGLALPAFWFGLVLIQVLAVWPQQLFGWSEPPFFFVGLSSPDQDPSFVDTARHMVLPVLTLTVGLVAVWSRFTRSSMLDALSSDYVRTARAKGVAGPVIVARHVLRNALIPVVTVIGLQTGYLLGGSVVVERLFAWPGLGDLMVNAIGARDFTLVQAITVIFVLGFLAITLVVELLYAAINPRLRRG